MTERWWIRLVIALAMMIAVGLATTATASPVSAQTFTCGSVTTSLEQANAVVNGVTVGYVELLTDGCGTYEVHGHLEQDPGGYTGPFDLTVLAGGFTYSAQMRANTAPADVYTPAFTWQTSAGLSAWYDIHVTNTDINYETQFIYQPA